MRIALQRLRTRLTPRYGPHYGVAAQGVLRGLGAFYILAFWSLASQVMALSGPSGLQPAGAFLKFLSDQHGAWAPWLFPGLGWISQEPFWLLSLCGIGVVAGLCLLYGAFPWVSGFVAWVSWISLIQLCQPWLSLPGDFLLAEMGLFALALVPIRSRTYPRVDQMASRITGIVLLNLLLVKVLFTAGILRLNQGQGAWADATALFHYFETQPLPVAAAWFFHQMPSFLLKYLLWGWLFIELMLPWYTFLPRTFRNIFAGGVILKSAVLLLTGQHGLVPYLSILLACSLVDDVSWRRLLPQSWGPTASTSVYQPQVAAWLALCILAPMLLLQAVVGVHRPLPNPWRGAEQLLGQVYASTTYRPLVEIPEVRQEISIQGSLDGQQWVEYRFWMKPTDPRSIPPASGLHLPRLDLAFKSASTTRALNKGQVPGWLYRLVDNLLRGEPTVQALFPANPFPEHPPRYIRLVLSEFRYADPVTRREQDLWWTRKGVGTVGPIFSLSPRTAPPSPLQPTL